MEESNEKFRNEIIPPHERVDVAKPNTSRKYLVTIGVALVLIAVTWIWKSMEISSVKKAAEQKQQALEVQATKYIVQSHEDHLKLLAKAYVWAVRTEMMQGNINQVNLFAADMVKEKNFQRIVIADDKGVIVSSTNKKDEGQPFSSIANEAGLTGNNTIVQNESDSILVLTSPIMGFNNRLGTLLIKYAVQPPTFSAK